MRLLIVVGIARDRGRPRQRLESLASPLPSRQIKVFTRLVLVVEIFQVIERRTHATNFALCTASGSRGAGTSVFASSSSRVGDGRDVSVVCLFFFFLFVFLHLLDDRVRFVIDVEIFLVFER